MMSLRDYEIYLLFLLLVKFHGSGGVNVRFTQEPSNPSYFNNGSDANLVWNYTDPLNEVQEILYKVEVDGELRKMIVKNSGGVQESPNIPPSYKGRLTIEGRATLVIKNINPGDNTNFYCELVGSFLDTFQSTVKLIVAVAPKINLSSRGEYYIEGSNVTIACEASGEPLPDVAWIRNGVLASSGNKAALLKFNNMNRMDAGQYTCQANNSVEVTAIDTTIVVHFTDTGWTKGVPTCFIFCHAEAPCCASKSCVAARAVLPAARHLALAFHQLEKAYRCLCFCDCQWYKKLLILCLSMTLQ